MSIDVDKLKSYLIEIWRDLFNDKNYWETIVEKINSSIIKGYVILPSFENIFKALNTIDFTKFKVLILGQDPYPTIGVPTGYAFSVSKETRLIPPSLKNVRKEVYSEFGTELNYTLDSWINQGVLLLNSVLTIGIKKPSLKDVHKGCGWELFIYDVLKFLDDNYTFVVLSWGVEASKIISRVIIKNKKNVIYSGHPSSLNTENPFVGCGCFKDANMKLLSLNLMPIKW